MEVRAELRAKEYPSLGMVEQVVYDVRAKWDILASPSGGSGGI